MTDRVDTAMNAVKVAGGQPLLNHPLRESE